VPRDIDISIIVPHDEYVKKYWKGVYEPDEDNPGPALIANAFYKEFDKIEPLKRLVFEGIRIDLKICPDNWWTEKEKLLLTNN
jgi:hypothetical protein